MGCAGCHPEGRDDGHVWHESRSRAGRAATESSFLASQSWRRNDPGRQARVPAADADARRAGERARALRLARAEPRPCWTASRKASVSTAGGTRIYPKRRWRARARIALVPFLRQGPGAAAAPERELTAEEKKGKAIFTSEQAQCSRCHAPETELHRPRRVPVLPSSPPLPGFEDEEDREFKTPSLLFVGGTPPYFHDGRAPRSRRSSPKTAIAWGKPATSPPLTRRARGLPGDAMRRAPRRLARSPRRRGARGAYQPLRAVEAAPPAPRSASAGFPGCQRRRGVRQARSPDLGVRVAHRRRRPRPRRRTGAGRRSSRPSSTTVAPGLRMVAHPPRASPASSGPWAHGCGSPARRPRGPRRHALRDRVGPLGRRDEGEGDVHPRREPRALPDGNRPLLPAAHPPDGRLRHGHVPGRARERAPPPHRPMAGTTATRPRPCSPSPGSSSTCPGPSARSTRPSPTAEPEASGTRPWERGCRRWG